MQIQLYTLSFPLLGSFCVALLLQLLNRQEANPYLKLLSGAWFVYTGIYATQFAAVLTGTAVAYLVVATLILAVVHPGMILAAMFALLGKDYPRWIAPLLGLCLAASLALFAAGYQSTLVSMPVMYIVGFLFIWFSSTLLQEEETDGIGRVLSSGALFFWGLIKTLYLLIRENSWLSFGSSALSWLLALLFSFGLILIYFERSHQNLKRQMMRLALFKDQSNEMVYHLSLQPRPHFTFVSPAAEKITGYSVEEYLNDPSIPQNSIHPEDRGEFIPPEEIHQELTAGLVRLIRKDGTIVWTEHKVRPVKDDQDNTLAVEGSVRLVNDLILSKQELERRNQELEILCENLAHDLNVPVRQLLSYNEIISDLHSRNESIHPYLDRTNTILKRIRMKARTLSWVSLSSNKSLVPRRLNLSALILETLSSMQNQFISDRQKLNVSVEEELYVFGDHSLLRIVCHELLSNALKFSRHESTVEIDVRKCPGPVGNTTVSLQDNGAGFSPDDVQSIFRPLSKLHSQTIEEGSGIGLSMVKRIIERHGGTVWATGSPNRGACIFISFPDKTTPGKPRIV